MIMWSRPGDHFKNSMSALEFWLLARASGELYRRITVGAQINTPFFREFPQTHQTYYLGYILWHLGSPMTEAPELTQHAESTIAAIFDIIKENTDDETNIVLSNVWQEHIQYWRRIDAFDDINHEDAESEWCELLFTDANARHSVVEGLLDTFLHDRDFVFSSVLTDAGLAELSFTEIPSPEIKQQTDFLDKIYEFSTKTFDEQIEEMGKHTSAVREKYGPETSIW